MTKQDAIHILITTLKFLWRVTKVVSVFVYTYGSIFLKWLWRTMEVVVPAAVYFIISCLLALIGGFLGVSFDSSSKPSRAPYRVWDSKENGSYYYDRR